MKLSNHYKVTQLLKERDRIRSSLADVMGDIEVKIEIRGRAAQGVERERIKEAMIGAWAEDLRENNERLKSLGVEPDDPPVRATQPPSQMGEFD